MISSVNIIESEILYIQITYIVYFSSKDTQGESFVNWHGCTNTHPDGIESSNKEHRGGDWSSKWVLELVDGLKEWDGDQTNWDCSHGQNSKKLIRDDSQGVEGWEEIPFRQNLERSGEWISRLTELGWLHHSKTNAQCNCTEDHDWENVKEIVWPGWFTVVVMAHSLGKLGTEDWIRKIRLLGYGIHNQKVSSSSGSVNDSSSEKTAISIRLSSSKIGILIVVLDWEAS